MTKYLIPLKDNNKGFEIHFLVGRAQQIFFHDQNTSELHDHVFLTSFDLFFEESAEDVKERCKLESMFSENALECCTRKCNKNIPKHLAQDARNTLAELSKEEQDLILLGYLQAHRQTKELEQFYRKQNQFQASNAHK